MHDDAVQACASHTPLLSAGFAAPAKSFWLASMILNACLNDCTVIRLGKRAVEDAIMVDALNFSSQIASSLSALALKASTPSKISTGRRTADIVENPDNSHRAQAKHAMRLNNSAERQRANARVRLARSGSQHSLVTGQEPGMIAAAADNRYMVGSPGSRILSIVL
jgi:hypothetical protein